MPRSGPARIDCLAKGEIYELYLAPIYQGLGFGERLFETCRFRLDKARLDGLIVWALNENEAAIDFYVRRGGRPRFSSSEHFGGTQSTEDRPGLALILPAGQPPPLLDTYESRSPPARRPEGVSDARRSNESAASWQH